MDLKGCRVVRGPDWKWGDQDGGGGGVGTIVSTDTFTDGNPLNKQTVLVHWDNGHEADYRLGTDGNYDLRILDSAPSGVCFNGVKCEGCGQDPLLGTRWKCADCDDYDLCTHCYNNDVHDLDHDFIRYDCSNLQSTPVGQRSSAVKVQAKGIFPGSEVTNGKYSEDDLGSMTGCVIMDHRLDDNIPVGKVLVEWSNEEITEPIKIEHRVGYDGKGDLKLERFAPDIYYYRDHLMKPSIVVDTDETFQVKDKVTVHLDLNDLHQISLINYGHWEAEMEKAISEVGIVESVDGRGITVKFDNMEEALVFPHSVLSKVHDLRIKDRVKISDYKEKVITLQKGHRGWNDKMEKVLGKEGIVTEVDEKGDAQVKVGEVAWWFNPAALILESKEEEREPAGTVVTGSSGEKAIGDGGASPVGEFLDQFVKAVKDETFMSKVADEYQSIMKNMPTPVIVVSDGFKGLDELANLVNTTDSASTTKKDDSLKGQACAAIQQEEKKKELESSDEDEDESVQLGVRPTKMEKIPQYDWPDKTDNVYKMTSHPRGVVMIINIQHFTIDPDHPMYGKLGDRDGSKKDEEDVTQLFRDLGFIIETIDNLTGDELLKELHRISTEYDFSDFDCFVLFVMSHGANDCIYASDGKQLTPSLIVSWF